MDWSIVLNLLQGVIVPLVVAFLAKSSYAGYVKGALMLALAFAVATVTSAAEQKLTLENIGESFFYVAAAAQISYTALTKQLAEYIQRNHGNTDKPELESAAS